jgi:hypothetical protein
MPRQILGVFYKKENILYVLTVYVSVRSKKFLTSKVFFYFRRMTSLNALLSSILTIVVSIVVMSLALWLSGRLLVGSKKAKFTDAIWISVLGSIASYIVGYFGLGLLGALITLVIVLLLVKHFFDCGWIKALLIAIIAAILFIVIVVILSLLGIGVVSLI